MSESRAIKPFDLIHTNVWGPTPVMSVDDFRYFLMILVDMSGYINLDSKVIPLQLLNTFLI